MKDSALTMLEEGRLTVLPNPAIFDKILARDDSEYARGDDKKFFELMFDFFVGKMLAVTAGKIYWGATVKYKDEVSKSYITTKDGKSKLRVPPSTEAFAVLCYKNCWNKWNAMFVDKKAHLNAKTGIKWVCPLYSKNKPTKNLAYKTEYTDSALGQPSKGGWSQEAMVEFVRLQKIVKDSRKAPGGADRFSRVEKACLERLRKNNLQDNETKKPKRKEVPAPRETLEWMEESD